MSPQKHYSSGPHSPEHHPDDSYTDHQRGEPIAPSRIGRDKAATRPMMHDLFWFLLVPVAFVAAPLIAWALREVVPVTGFDAAGLSPQLTSLATDVNAGLLLFAISGWLFLLGVWFFRTPDPDRNFIDYCRGGMIFAFLFYVWALAPTLASLFLAVLTKGSV